MSENSKNYKILSYGKFENVNALSDRHLFIAKFTLVVSVLRKLNNQHYFCVGKAVKP